MRYFILSVIALILGGCSTGVVPMGRDTYMISKKGSTWSTGAGLRAQCAREANAWCVKRGLVMVPLDSNGNNGGVGLMGSGELLFRAVPPGDAEDGRPKFERAPNHIQEYRYR